MLGLTLGLNKNNRIPLIDRPLDYNDMYSHAIIGVSLYKLSKLYTGPCLKVRRSSDNEEKDIGFSGGFVNVKEIESFCNGTTGYVIKWYDQSLNDYDFTQSDTAKQPKIFDNNSFLQNGLEFNGVNNYLDSVNTNDYCEGIYLNFLTKKLITGTESGPNLLTFNLSGAYGGIRFGNTTGLLTNEVIAVYSTNVERSGWCDINGTVPININHKLLCSFDNITPKWDINLNGSQKNITTSGTPIALLLNNPRIGGRGDNNGDWLQGNCKTFILFDTSSLSYEQLSKV